jgi:hypothetical protein
LILLVNLLTLVACHSAHKIPDVAVYRELPFDERPEALEVWTVRKDFRILTPDEWEVKRPFMLMVPPETWTEIKKSWLSACILAGDKCTQDVYRVDNFVESLDKIIKKIVEAK